MPVALSENIAIATPLNSGALVEFVGDPLAFVKISADNLKVSPPLQVYHLLIIVSLVTVFRTSHFSLLLAIFSTVQLPIKLSGLTKA